MVGAQEWKKKALGQRMECWSEPVAVLHREGHRASASLAGWSVLPGLGLALGSSGRQPAGIHTC